MTNKCKNCPFLQYLRKVPRCTHVRPVSLANAKRRLARQSEQGFIEFTETDLSKDDLPKFRQNKGEPFYLEGCYRLNPRPLSPSPDLTLASRYDLSDYLKVS